jgi:hypothetical protein
LIEATTQPRQCQVRSRTDLPCGRPAVASILGVRFCERCAREQEDYFAVGELTQVPRGKSDVTEGVGYAARVSRLGYTAGPEGRSRRPVARSSVEVFLLLVVGAILLLATAACGGAGQARGGSDDAEAKVEPETTAQERSRPAEPTAEGNGTHGSVARTDDADGAEARAGDAVARAENSRARAGEAAREEDGGETPQKNAAANDRPREDRPRQSHPEKLTLKVGGDPGSEFSGVCSLGKEEKTIGGSVPERYVFEPGDAGLECEIRKEGSGVLKVVVAGDNVRSVQRSGGAGEGTVRFAFSGDGISYSTSSISLSQTAVSSDRSSSNDPR